MVILPLPPLQVVFAITVPFTFMVGLLFGRLMLAVLVQPFAPVTVTS